MSVMMRYAEQLGLRPRGSNPCRADASAGGIDLWALAKARRLERARSALASDKRSPDNNGIVTKASQPRAIQTLQQGLCVCGGSPC